MKGVAAPLPTGHPFYILMESSGSDAERLRTDLEKLLEEALGEEHHPRCDDCKLGRRGRGDLADSRFHASSSAARSAPSVGFDISLAIDRMEAFANAIEKAIKKVDKDAS